jgi:transglutaminase superfamily protein
MRQLTAQGRLPLRRRVALWVRIVRCYAEVRRRLSREPLPALAASFGNVPVRTGDPIPPRQLGWAVDRTLRIGSHRPRCIFNALVLYRLLREQGDAAVLVVGLPPDAITKDAHAWVELDGVDVGPPPGQAGHEPMARFA